MSLFKFVLFALVGLSAAFVPPTIALSRSVARSSEVSMIGKKFSKPKKVVAKKTQETEWGFFDFLNTGRDGGAGGLELVAPVNKRRTPKEYDTRSFKAKKVEKSGKINPKDTSTW